MITGELLTKLFESCKNGRCLNQLHSLTIKTGLTHHTFFAAKLINLYSQFTNPRTTRKLFDEIPHRTVYIWNCILKCYCRHRQYKESLLLFSQFCLSEKPDVYTVPIALKSCSGLKALDFGKIIHAFVKKTDQIDGSLFVGSALIELYSKCGKMKDALCVFEEYIEPDTVLWTTMITGYEQNGEPLNALEFFARMTNKNGVLIDPITLVSVVSACAKIFDLNLGRSVHGYMIRMGYESILSLSNALLNLYGKTGAVDAASKLFKKMEEKDVISWGSMITCYAHNCFAEEALVLFEDMLATGIEPNTVVFISALQACEATCNVEMGKKIHKIAVRKGFDLDILASTALIEMYMSSFCPDEAVEVFEHMPKKDVVCFSAMLHGFVQNGRESRCIGVFRDMLACNFHPDHFDLVKILTACSELGVFQQTSCMHGFMIKGGLVSNSFISASLIESYAKCGSLDSAISVFRQIIDRDVVIWSSMLAAYGFHGKGKEALDLFNDMIENSLVRPNDVSFLSVLSACSHAGLVKEGIKIFNVMVKDYDICPNSKHYGIVVDLLGRIGELKKAMVFIGQMQERVEANIWGALLGACKIHQNIEIGEIAAKELHRLDYCHAGYYILLSNMYAVDEMWANAADVRKLVREKKLKKVTGQSVVEIKDEVYTFVANDRSHRDSELIYEVVTMLEGKMKEVCNNFSMDVMLHESCMQ